MAGEMRQEWTWRDIFRSIGLAFSFSRLLVGFFGLALMVCADTLLAWAGYETKLAGHSFEGEVTSPWLVWIGAELFWYIRVVVLGYLFLGTATAVAYGVKGELLDGEGAGAKESINFALKKIGAVFWTPVIFWIYILLMSFLGLVWFLLGLIPVAGPSIMAAGWFFVFLFSVLAAMGLLAFLFSFFLAPPIIATRQEGALDAVLDTIDLMRGKGAFWVSILVLAAAMLLGRVFLVTTFQTTYKVAEMTTGKNYTETVKCLPRQIQPRPGTFFNSLRVFWPKQELTAEEKGVAEGMTPDIKKKPKLDTEPEAGSLLALSLASGEWQELDANYRSETRYVVGGWWLGIMILIVTGFAISFTLGAFVSAATLTYLIVREEEEFLEPVSVAPAAPAAEKEEPAKEEKKSGEKKSDEKKSKKKSKKESKSGSDESKKK